jgi:hypothetical protein
MQKNRTVVLFSKLIVANSRGPVITNEFTAGNSEQEYATVRRRE